MMIKITKSCSNGCIHCMQDAKKCNEHMTIKTFKDTLEFIKKYDDNKAHIISGGEPTEHPQFFEFIDTFYDIMGNNNILSICTNGHFVLENHEKVKEYLDKYPGLYIQITYDNRYYPKKLDVTKRALRHKKIKIVENVQPIRPIGRAITNNIPIKKYFPPACMNLNLLAIQSKSNSLKDIIYTARTVVKKECIPSIQIDGFIGFGELDQCPKIVSIYNTEDEIVSALKHIDSSCCQVEFEHLSESLPAQLTTIIKI